MNAQDEYIQLKDHWRHKILAANYVVVGVVFWAEIVLFLLRVIFNGTFNNGILSHFLIYVVVPAILNFLSVIIAQYIQNRSDSESIKNYAVVYSLLIICTVVATIHSFFLVTSAAFVAPIVVSCILDDVKVTRISGICSMVLLFVSALIAPIFDDVWSVKERWYNVMAGFVIVFVIYYICMSMSAYIKEKNEIIYHTSLTQERMSLALKMDAMTNLFNHSEFYRSLEESINHSQSNELPLSVAVIDVDLFKKVNDTYGHENGDIVLIKIASILKENCPECGKAFRYGGEEFAMILEGYTAGRTYDLIEEIRQTICAEKFSFMPGKHCSISTGIYQYDGGDMSGEDIFNKADEAMYQAKQNGRNRTICSANE